jgi:hypothetical protein
MQVSSEIRMIVFEEVEPLETFMHNSLLPRILNLRRVLEGIYRINDHSTLGDLSQNMLREILSMVRRAHTIGNMNGHGPIPFPGKK